MRPAMAALAAVDVVALAAAPGRRSRPAGLRPDGPSRLATDLLDATVGAHGRGRRRPWRRERGSTGLLDAVVLAPCVRLLRYELDRSFDNADGFGWLDITHGLTTAKAVRWAWRADPGPDTARLALFATCSCPRRAGRRRSWAGPERADRDGPTWRCPAAGGLRAGRVWPSAAAGPGAWRTTRWPWPSAPTGAVGDALDRAALDDGAGSFIVAAHLVKTAARPPAGSRREAGHQPAAGRHRPVPGRAPAGAVRGPQRGRVARVPPHGAPTPTLSPLAAHGRPSSH